VFAYSVYGYKRGTDEDSQDVSRWPVPEWNLTKAIRWALEQGCDSLVVEQRGTIRAQPGVTHHLCNDHTCPGGCG
jgi:hypothetical protein